MATGIWVRGERSLPPPSPAPPTICGGAGSYGGQWAHMEVNRLVLR